MQKQAISHIKQLFRSDLGPLLTAVVTGIVLLSLSIQSIWPLEIDIGVNDRRFSANFNAIEDFAGTSVRWSNGDSLLSLPRPPGDGLLVLRLLNSRPEGEVNPELELIADGTRLGSFPVQYELSGARVYRVLAPQNASLDWATRINLRSETFTPANDARQLGVVIDRASIGPLTNGWYLPQAWLLVWSALLSIVAYTTLRSIDLQRNSALAWTLLLVALMALGVALRPLEFLPFIGRIALLFGAGLIGIWVARLLAPPLTLDGQQAVRGRDLVLYLGVASWLGPLYQWLMTADGAFNVTPNPVTTRIGLVLIAALSLGLGLYYLFVTRKQPSSQARTSITNAAIVLFACASLAHLIWMLSFAYTRSGPDFWILFKGTRDWARGGSLYDLVAVQTNHFGHVFKVPPFYGMLFLPFVFQSGEVILQYQRILNTVLIVLSCLIWCRMWGIRLLSLGAAGMLILLNFRAIADVLAFGQIDLVLLTLMILTLYCVRREWDILAGVLLALAALFKLYPVILLGFFFVKGQWRVLIGFALGMLVFNGIAVAVMGWEMHRIYLLEVIPGINGTTAYADNQTFAGFVARFIASPKAAEIVHNPLISLLYTAVAGLSMAFACYLSLRDAKPTSTTYTLQFGLFLLMMVLVVPAAWMHYQTLLLIVFACFVQHWRNHNVSLQRVALLALAFGAIVYGNQWSFYDGTVMGFLTVFGVSYKFYAMLALGALMTLSILETPALLPEDHWLHRLFGERIKLLGYGYIIQK
jgi:hypothetical protein